MSTSWRLKSYIAQNHSIYTATDFQKKIIKKTGIIISLVQLSKILKKKPVLIRLETMEIICSALNCNLTQFMNIKPKKYKLIKGEEKKLSYKNTPHSQRGVHQFPDPQNYFE
ncbi:MAG: helix-turn-helix transcriptional regulator [Bacteroidales bacterium]|nr:helix-turn-helix transcriptional regulator [Bacteroidales bacterium]